MFFLVHSRTFHASCHTSNLFNSLSSLMRMKVGFLIFGVLCAHTHAVGGFSIDNTSASSIENIQADAKTEEDSRGGLEARSDLDCILFDHIGCQTRCAVLGTLFQLETNTSSCSNSLECICDFRIIDDLTILWNLKFKKTDYSNLILNEILQNSDPHLATNAMLILKQPLLTAVEVKNRLKNILDDSVVERLEPNEEQPVNRFVNANGDISDEHYEKMVKFINELLTTTSLTEYFDYNDRIQAFIDSIGDNANAAKHFYKQVQLIGIPSFVHHVKSSLEKRGNDLNNINEEIVDFTVSKEIIDEVSASVVEDFIHQADRMLQAGYDKHPDANPETIDKYENEAVFQPKIQNGEYNEQLTNPKTIENYENETVSQTKIENNESNDQRTAPDVNIQPEELKTENGENKEQCTDPKKIEKDDNEAAFLPKIENNESNDQWTAPGINILPEELIGQTKKKWHGDDSAYVSFERDTYGTLTVDWQVGDVKIHLLSTASGNNVQLWNFGDIQISFSNDRWANFTHVWSLGDSQYIRSHSFRGTTSGWSKGKDEYDLEKYKAYIKAWCARNSLLFSKNCVLFDY